MSGVLRHGHFRKVCEHGQVVSQCRCPAPKTDEVISPCPFPEHGVLADPVAELAAWAARQTDAASLDGATDPGDLMAVPSTPGEFAARWNAMTEEQRVGFLNALRVADERATRCRMVHR